MPRILKCDDRNHVFVSTSSIRGMFKDPFTNQFFTIISVKCYKCGYETTKRDYGRD